MKTESAMWRRLRPVLVAAKLDPIRIENAVHPGTPDVNVSTGDWIELKTIAAWPARASSIVRLPHFTPQQRVWLFRRWQYAPGSTYLLLEVRADRQWLLFDGDVAAKGVGRATSQVHRDRARAIFDVHELARLPDVIVATLRDRKAAS